MSDLWNYEHICYDEGFEIVCGIDEAGRVITQGDQVFLGGNDSYVAMCHKCWVDKIKAQQEK